MKIIPEERAELREECTELREECKRSNTIASYKLNKILDKLEAAEVRAEEMEQERDILAAHIVLFMCENCPTKSQCQEQEPKAKCLNTIRNWAAQARKI